MVVEHRFDEGWPRYEPEIELGITKEEAAPKPAKKAARKKTAKTTKK